MANELAKFASSSCSFSCYNENALPLFDQRDFEIEMSCLFLPNESLF